MVTVLAGAAAPDANEVSDGHDDAQRSTSEVRFLQADGGPRLERQEAVLGVQEMREQPTVEPIISRTPALEPVVTSAPSVTPAPVLLAPAQEEFARGYRNWGVNPQWLDHFLYVVVPCESRWQLDPSNPAYRGLAQFDPGTWAAAASVTGCWDWLDPYCQGKNCSAWSGMADPGSTAGWPWCWHGY